MVEGRPLVWSSLTLPDGLTVGTELIPSGADTVSLGSTSAEFLNLYIGDAGKIYFGLSQDVDLYRSEANVLATDDTFQANALVISQGVAGTFGAGQFLNPTSGRSTELYIGQSVASNACLVIGYNHTDNKAYLQLYGDPPYSGISIIDGGHLVIGSILTLGADGNISTSGTFYQIANDSGEIKIGASLDVNIKRGGANLLQTDDVFKAAGYQSSDGTVGATGTITLATTTTITVKNGLITAWA